MEIKLKENERIDDLEFKNLKIIQNKDGFCFGIDSILLTDFAKNIKQNSKVIDLGTGTGIIPILLYGKTKNTKFVGVEIQPEVAEMADRSVKLNLLENNIEILNTNILELSKIYNRGSFDVVTTNPPYKKINTGVINENNKKLIAKVNDKYVILYKKNNEKQINIEQITKINKVSSSLGSFIIIFYKNENKEEKYSFEVSCANKNLLAIAIHEYNNKIIVN